MKLFPFRRSRRNPSIDALYGMIVAQARSPAFYRGYGVPDTVEGRFDMILLHLALLLRRLRETASEGPMGQEHLGQELFDRFCRDMDGNFREMGVGDLAVPKRMLQVAEAFYGRAAAYDQALDGGDAAALEAALGRNVFGGGAALGARRLATYMRQAATGLAVQDGLARGELRFPDPDAVVEPSEGARQP